VTEQIIGMYAGWGKPSQAAEWRTTCRINRPIDDTMADHEMTGFDDLGHSHFACVRESKAASINPHLLSPRGGAEAGKWAVIRAQQYFIRARATFR
jgi:hypothetical protein